MLSTTVSDSPAMRVAIFIPSYGDGGVERMLVNLAGGWPVAEWMWIS